MAENTRCPTCGADPDVQRELERVYAAHLSWNTVRDNLSPHLHDYDATTQYLIRHGFSHSRRGGPGTWLRVTPTGGTSVRVPQPNDPEWADRMADVVCLLALEEAMGELGVLAEIARCGVMHDAR